MNAIAHRVLDPTDFRQTVMRDLLDDDSARVRPRGLHDDVGLHRSPILRGAAYLAALDGDPWRPHV